jgi:hypothetical protein
MTLSVDAMPILQKYETPIGQPSRQISASSFLGENGALEDGEALASAAASSSDTPPEGRASEPSPSSS